MEIFNPPESMADMLNRIADPKLKGADHRSAPAALKIICTYPKEQGLKGQIYSPLWNKASKVWAFCKRIMLY